MYSGLGTSALHYNMLNHSPNLDLPPSLRGISAF